VADRAWRVDLGRLEYGAAWALQKALVERRIAQEIPDALLLLEHDAVVTLGRKVRGEARALIEGTPTYEVERGGDLTYHGPGQLVVYPIVALPKSRRDLGRYLRDLEHAILGTLERFGVAGRREPGWTGVWVGERKIASLGVAVRKWVTYHGLALNVTDEPLEAFRRLSPCGLPGSVMTSLASEVARVGGADAPSPKDVADALANALADVLGLDLDRPSTAERAQIDAWLEDAPASAG
jgi:lipoate-protein ligase B